MPENNILQVSKLGVDFGGLTAVNNFNLTIGKNEIIGLIGPNGAGKTTEFNLLTKVYQPTRGKIVLNGQDLEKMDTVAVNHAGIARTFQNIRLFNQLSVLENVLVGMDRHIGYSTLDGIFRTKKFYREEKAAKEKAMELLKIFHLDEFADYEADNLSYGAQRRLEIARALASDPCLLLLDEPAAGMNPSETVDLMNTIRTVRDRFQISILLIEHDMKLVMGICERITVLNYGTVLAEGTPEEIQKNPQVIKAYLGGV